MMQEVYQITVTHYMQDDEGKRIKLGEPIICNAIYERRFGNVSVLLNQMLDEVKNYVMRRAMEGGAE